MKKAIVSVFAAMVSLSAHAGVVSEAGEWWGTGVSYTADGTKAQEYLIELTNLPTDDHTIETQGTVTAPDGTVIQISETLTDSGNGFSIQSKDGNGGGVCGTNGMCEAYTSQGSSARAISITLDGKNHMRAFITLLTSNQPVGFFSENLSRKE